MASKVLVNLPAVTFLQGRKSPSDMVTLHERNEILAQGRKQQSNAMDRIAQLEQNMKFLQEEHQATLVALHQEVEVLRQKNRDLQFELVFAKGSNSALSSPTSSEENASSGFAKSKCSPVSVNVRPLHIELLEKELQDTKACLQEAKTQNQYLMGIVEEQKIELSRSEDVKSKMPPSSNSVAIQVADELDPVQADLLAYLKVAEAMVKRLRRKTEEQRKEIAMLKAPKPNESGNTSNAASTISQARDPKNSRHRPALSNDSSEQLSSHKFPPLQTQQGYWLRRFPRSGRNRHEKAENQPQSESDSPTSLPQLPEGSGKAEAHQSESPTAHSFRGYRNQYREESNRKYRTQFSSQRDRRESEHYQQHQHQEHQRRQHHQTSYHRHQPQQYHHRREYKERNAKERPRLESDGECDGAPTTRKRDTLQQ